MDLGLHDKIAIVAAASQGLGKAAAIALAGEGARVVICARTKKDLEATAAELRDRTGAEIFPIVADVSKPANITSLVTAAKKKFGTVHILVNNAGGPPTGDILSLSDNEWKKGVELTLMSTIRLTRAALPLMIAQRWGRIITIVSFVAKQPVNDLLISSTLRPGILTLSKILSNKHAKDNITVNTLCPGYILTKRQEDLMRARSAKSKTSMEEYLAETTRQIPAGRLGTPEEIGSVIAFLASEQASYITGANLMVDGGLAKSI
jgi:3-oxoacyl-[acyl-carrier protein] reductase